MTLNLAEPRDSSLNDLLAGDERAEELRAHCRQWPSWDLTARQLCDLELLLNGGFSPLAGFMGRADWADVCNRMRLRDNTVWPLPVVLDVTQEAASAADRAGSLALRDMDGTILAVLRVDDVWQGDRRVEAEQVFGTTRTEHPGVQALLDATRPYCIGGRVEGLALPSHYDFPELRLTPVQLRRRFASLGWRNVVAFQTRNPMHRAHVELTWRAAAEMDAGLLIHPVVGMTKPGDVDHYTRVRCYQAVLGHYPKGTALLSLLPLAMRMAGPREALLHAIVRRNYGCTHLIVGRDHAGPGLDSSGKPFYGPYDAQKLLRQYQDEVGIQMVPFQMMVYVEDKAVYMPIDEVPPGAKTRTISGTELRDSLMKGREIPPWFSFPEVIAELRRTYPPRCRQGLTVFFTGLPSSGKSTLANILIARLMAIGGRSVTLLDGDLVRKHLSSELGFSKAHRDINIRRIGWVASEITKSGGVAVCAPIAPYDEVRREVRAMIEPVGGFILVHVATPVAVCEQRDRKGLYAKARAGIIKEFTGISDPYEVPQDAEMVIDTTTRPAHDSVQSIILYLQKEGFIGAT